MAQCYLTADCKHLQHANIHHFIRSTKHSYLPKNSCLEPAAVDNQFSLKYFFTKRVT